MGLRDDIIQPPPLTQERTGGLSKVYCQHEEIHLSSPILHSFLHGEKVIHA